MNEKMLDLRHQIKENISQLVNLGRIDAAKALISEYELSVKNDIEICSIKAVIAIMEGRLQDAEGILKDALMIDSSNFDINYNLAYVYSQLQDFNRAYRYYKKAKELCKDDNIKNEINSELDNILKGHKEEIREEKKKIAFFVKQNMDSFLGDIIDELSYDYETKKIVVTQYGQIDEGMKWADICWFEWCDELVIYGSKLEIAKDKKVICRLHSYEGFTSYPQQVNWNSVDKIVFVAEHIRNYAVKKFNMKSDDTVVIHNGVDIERYSFRERKAGFNIAYVGYINYKKGPMLLLHTFKAIFDKDNRYKLYIAGQFQDDRDVLYFEQMIKEFGIEKNVFYEGWQENLDEWLENKDYILCTSILESQNISVMQAMAKGIKPIIHNFVGANSIYPVGYIWNTIDEAVKMITSDEYNSDQYRGVIAANYSLQKQLQGTKVSIESILNSDKGYKIKKEEREKGQATVWDNLWDNYSKVDIISLMNEQSGITLRSEFISLLNKFFVLKNSKILEVGCGSGQTLVELSFRQAKCMGIDISDKSVKLASEISKKFNTNNCNFQVGDGFNLSFKKKSFDLVYNLGVIEHFSDSDIIKMLKEMGRVGKYVVLGVPFSKSKIYKLTKEFCQSNNTWEYGFERDFESLKCLVEKAGLKLLHEEVIGYCAEVQYLKRINPNVISTALAQNIEDMFNDKGNVGSWLIAIASKEDTCRNLFLDMTKTEKISFEDDKCAIKTIKYPSVSIVIPFLNGERYASQLAHNLSQIDYPQFEAILVNDGSNDKSESILLNELRDLKVNFSIKTLEKNHGIFRARLEGMMDASGDYIFFHNIDDIIYKKGIFNIANDLSNFSDDTYLATSCALMKQKKFMGQIWYHELLSNIDEYILSEVYNLCGKVSIINTLISKNLLLDAYKKVEDIFCKIGVDRMSVAEDTVLMDYMILNGYFNCIIPIYYTLQGYEYDNFDSSSKKVYRRVEEIPIQTSYCVTKLFSNKTINMDQMKQLDSIVSSKSASLYGAELGKRFYDNYLKFKGLYTSL